MIWSHLFPTTFTGFPLSQSVAHSLKIHPDILTSEWYTSKELFIFFVVNTKLNMIKPLITKALETCMVLSSLVACALNWWNNENKYVSSCLELLSNSNEQAYQDGVNTPAPGGGHSTFFQVGVCGPDSRSVGLANWHLPLKRGACERKISKFGGLWAENFQIWGLVS